MGNLSFTSSSEAGKVLSKLVLALALFFALNIIVYIPLNHMYFNTYGGNSGAQINNVLRQKSDVFIFGASRASHHYNTDMISKQTGLTVFNAGDDGKNSAYQLGLLKMLVKRHKPKLIIYEVGDIYGHDGGTVDLFPYYFHDSDVRSVLIRRDTWITFKMMFPLYIYNQKILSLIKSNLSLTNASQTGYKPITGVIVPEEVARAKSEFLNEFHQRSIAYPDDLLAEYFARFIMECRAQGIGIILVFSPSFMPTNPIGEPVIRDIASRTELHLYDFGINSKYNWNMNLFKDAAHLNSIGADEFTQDLIDVTFMNIH